MDSTIKPTDTYTLRGAAIWMAVVLVLTGLGGLGVSEALEWDAAEQAIHSQFLLMGYGPQPPLYDWLVWGFFALVGPSATVLVLLKAGLLWLIFLWAGLFFRSITQSEPLAVAGAMSVFLPAQLMWEAQRNLSHTVLAVMFAALFFYWVFRLVRDKNPDQSLFAYAILGLVITGGLLSKYNMAAVFVFTFISVLAVPTLRSRLRITGVVLAVLIPLVVCSPHAAWAMEYLPEISEAMRSKFSLAAAQEQGPVGLRVLGIKEFVLGVLGYVALPLLVWGGLIIWCRRRTVRLGLNEPGTSIELPKDFYRFVRAGRVYLVLFMLMGLGMTVFGQVSQFRDRWFTPFLFLLPGVVMVLWLARYPQGVSPFFRVGQVLLVVAGVGLAARVPLAGWMGAPGYANRPIQQVAEHINAATPKGTLVVAQDIRLLGSLRFYLEDRPVMLTPRFLNSPVRPVCHLLLIDPTEAARIGRVPDHEAPIGSEAWSWQGQMRFSTVPYFLTGNLFDLGC